MIKFWIGYATLVGVMLGAIGFIEQAKGHEGFLPWCCNDGDCKPAKVQFLPDGRIKATHYDTGLSRIFDKGTRLRSLPPAIKDRSDWYACMTPHLPVQARCLYRPDLGM